MLSFVMHWKNIILIDMHFTSSQPKLSLWQLTFLPLGVIMKNAFFVLTALLFTFGAQASANAQSDSVRAFSQYVSYLQATNPIVLQNGPLDGGIVFLKDQPRLEIEPAALQLLAYTASQVVRAPVQITQVEALYAGPTLAGYRVTYASPAIKGRQAIFVTPNYGHTEIDRSPAHAI
jgi:hypothetical protein